MIHSCSEFGLIVAAAQSLLRRSRIATIATLESPSYHPFASLIAIATEWDGTPVFLISRLAVHTRNLEADPRASLLVAEHAGQGDPLNAGRLTLKGRARISQDPQSREAFLVRHPGAALYADFADFHVWRMEVEGGHYVGGFGKIASLRAEDVLLSGENDRVWRDEASCAIESVNAAAPELIGRLASCVPGQVPAGWRIAACDPMGCDLTRGEETRRLGFPDRLTGPRALREALEMLASARAADSG